METRRVPYNPEPKIVFQADCEFCHHAWFPFENTNRTINPPTEILLECPKCEKKTTCFFPDSKMKKDILYRKHVLGYDEKIKNYKTKLEKLTTERDEWKGRHDKLFENNIKLTNAIDRIAKKLEELGVEVDNNDKNPIAG